MAVATEALSITQQDQNFPSEEKTEQMLGWEEINLKGQDSETYSQRTEQEG